MPAHQLTGQAADPDGILPPASRAAGQEWQQVYIQFADWAASEQDAVQHLVPLLSQAHADGLVTAWWFMRKHPCWRLRLRPGPGGHATMTHLAAALDGLAANRKIHRWWPGIYEAEEAAFGGPKGMTAAHDLFTADSQCVMDLISGTEMGLGRRELSLLLCGILMRSAGLEFYEQGDTWHRAARERPLPPDVPAERLTGMSASLMTLILADTTSDGGLLGPSGPAAAATGWADAFRHAGRTLGADARAGVLQRGLREVLSYHIIFHWNRLGLPARQQAILAWSARGAILGPPHPAPAGPVRRRSRVAGAALGLDRIATRFPLVPRPRLACPDLETRVRQVRDYALSCHQPAEPEDRVDRACTAWNQAALIAADCGLPELAARLCERQFAILRSAWPVGGRTAIASLQPLVNLARLDIRAGLPEQACQALDQIHHAVNHGGSAVIHGAVVSLDGFTTAGAAAPVHRWLRDVLLQDGTRALAATGQWARAAEHAARYDDTPDRLLEGRQARIIASSDTGNAAGALDLIDASNRTEPWEHAVAACLRALACLKTSGPLPSGIIAALAAVPNACQQAVPGTVLFRIRLALTVAELTIALDGPHDDLVTNAIENARQSGDAQAAREILGHPAARSHLTPAFAGELAGLVDRAGLGRGSVPQALMANLTASVDAAETVLTLALEQRHRS